jgi:hypothetical protein
MVTDFVSPDYGWLQSPDGAQKAWVIFKASKNRCNVPYTADLGNHIHRLTSSPTLVHADYHTADTVPHLLHIADAVLRLLRTAGTILRPLHTADTVLHPLCPCW